MKHGNNQHNLISSGFVKANVLWGLTHLALALVEQHVNHLCQLVSWLELGELESNIGDGRQFLSLALKQPSHWYDSIERAGYAPCRAAALDAVSTEVTSAFRE